MRAMKLDRMFFVAVVSATLFVPGLSAGATAGPDLAKAKRTDVVTVQVAHPAEAHPPRSDAGMARPTVPYRHASESNHDLTFASLSPAPATQAATAQPQQVPRSSTKDLLLLTLVGGMLVAYQLLRKHRLLRQQPFSL